MINRIDNARIWDATRVVFDEAGKDGRQMAIAVTDEAGSLVFGARMEQAAARILTHAIRKAYTSAVMQRDTITFRDEDADRQIGGTTASRTWWAGLSCARTASGSAGSASAGTAPSGTTRSPGSPCTSFSPADHIQVGYQLIISAGLYSAKCARPTWRQPLLPVVRLLVGPGCIGRINQFIR
jgi:Haem degrading protein HbpS-like